MKNKLQKARLNKGLSQEQMADLIGMTQSSYCRREKGKISISNIEWDKIAKVLDLKKDAIYEGDEQPTNKPNINSSIVHDNKITEVVLQYIELLKTENSKLKEKFKKNKNVYP